MGTWGLAELTPCWQQVGNAGPAPSLVVTAPAAAVRECPGHQSSTRLAQLTPRSSHTRPHSSLPIPLPG